LSHLRSPDLRDFGLKLTLGGEFAIAFGRELPPLFGSLSSQVAQDFRSLKVTGYILKTITRLFRLANATPKSVRERCNVLWYFLGAPLGGEGDQNKLVDGKTN